MLVLLPYTWPLRLQLPYCRRLGMFDVLARAFSRIYAPDADGGALQVAASCWEQRRTWRAAPRSARASRAEPASARPWLTTRRFLPSAVIVEDRCAAERRERKRYSDIWHTAA